MKWFGVRTLFVYRIAKAKSAANAKNSGKSYFEERTVLFKAKSFSDAIRKAEKDARKYEDDFVNAYGETIEVRYLRAADAFEIIESPKEGVEVYSSTEVFGIRLSEKAYVDSKLGKIRASKTESALRKRFHAAAYFVR